ncbi:14175_t:CDS:2 [Funneliformis mosseae]|uniref:14175_t:CDS:1 n=1 Tax=Funneliformis mosseae TaxID=27381 RepID=A0A9N8V676_FUNMO|nr:14175_t:CDS:2 [Funneliformis mosseae]
MSGNTQNDSFEEASNASNEESTNGTNQPSQDSCQSDEIYYQSNESETDNERLPSTSLDECTQKDTLVTPLVESVSDSSTTDEEVTYEIPNFASERNDSHETTQEQQQYDECFQQNSNQPNLNEQPTRIDPSLLNFENNVTMQATVDYGRPFTSIRDNPISNNQSSYWNEARPLPSSPYYGIASGTNTLGYGQLIDDHVVNASLANQSFREYMAMTETQMIKGKKKKGRKSESEYSRLFSSIPSPTFIEGIRQNEIVQCSNCGVHDTPAWRRDLQGIALLCNACGLYLKNKGVHRPTEIAPDGTVRLRRTQRPEFACHNCGTNNAPYWRGPEGQKLCLLAASGLTAPAPAIEERAINGINCKVASLGPKTWQLGKDGFVQWSCTGFKQGFQKAPAEDLIFIELGTGTSKDFKYVDTIDDRAKVREKSFSWKLERPYKPGKNYIIRLRHKKKGDKDPTDFKAYEALDWKYSENFELKPFAKK